MMKSSEDDSSASEKFEFSNYKSLVFAEIELIERIFEIRQNFLNFPDSERIVKPILQRIYKIRSEKLILENKFNLI